MNSEHPDSKPRGAERKVVSPLLIGFFLSVLLLALAITVGSSGLAVANNTTNISDNASYYENDSGNVSADYWFDEGNATADSIVDMAARLIPTIIGVGDQDPSNTGYEGVLLTALVFGATALVATMGTGIGPVGGTILGLVFAFGMVSIGMAPAWMSVVVLFGIGIAGAVAALRITRA